MDIISEEQQGEICKKVLKICQKVSGIHSPTQMAGTIRNFWTTFDSSKCFNEVLPKLVKNEAWQKDNVDSVQNFIENLLKVLPQCGIRAIEIVASLNIPGESGLEFMKKLLSILALNVTGVRDNLKHLKWNQQPIIPVSSELLTTG